MTFDDIKALADTRKKACPHMMGDECKGPQCAFWVRETFANAQDQASTIDGCMFVMQFLVGQTTMVETRRVNATLAANQKSMVASAERVAERLRDRANGPRILENNPIPG